MAERSSRNCSEEFSSNTNGMFSIHLFREVMDL